MGGATNWRYPLLWELSTSGGYQLMGSILQWGCPLMGGVHLMGTIH